MPTSTCAEQHNCVLVSDEGFTFGAGGFVGNITFIGNTTMVGNLNVTGNITAPWFNGRVNLTGNLNTIYNLTTTGILGAGALTSNTGTNTKWETQEYSYGGFLMPALIPTAEDASNLGVIRGSIYQIFDDGGIGFIAVFSESGNGITFQYDDSGSGVGSINSISELDLQGTSISINKYMSLSLIPLDIYGKYSATAGNRRGGHLGWYHGGIDLAASTLKGYTYVNTNGQFVWDTTAQASTTDTGVAWVDFDDGSASFTAVTNIGGVFTGKNSESIQVGVTDDMIDFVGAGGTTNQALRFDLDDTNGPVLSTTTGTMIQFADSLYVSATDLSSGLLLNLVKNDYDLTTAGESQYVFQAKGGTGTTANRYGTRGLIGAALTLDMQSDSGNAQSSSVVGFWGLINIEGDADITNDVWPVFGQTVITGAGAITRANGGSFGISHKGSGTLTTARVLETNLNVNSGATISYGYGLYGKAPTNAGTLTRYSHIWLDDATAAGTNYGIVIDSDTIGLTLGADQDAKIYFDGTNSVFNTSGILQIKNRTGDGAISSADFIDLTSVFGKSAGSSLDFAKDRSQLIYVDAKTGEEAVNHSAFYGAVTFQVTDWDKPVNESYEEEVCKDIGKPEDMKKECHNETLWRIVYPFTKTETGVSISNEMALIRQQIYDLNEKEKSLEMQLCYKDIFCIAKMGIEAVVKMITG
jgi:hypothetical protein